MRTNKVKLKKGDRVLVLSGRDKGKRGDIVKILYKKGRALVEGINMATHHTKGNPMTGQAGGIIKKEAPLNITNLMLLCPKCTEPTRISVAVLEPIKTASGNMRQQRARVCKKCEAQID